MIFKKTLTYSIALSVWLSSQSWAVNPKDIAAAGADISTEEEVSLYRALHAIEDGTRFNAINAIPDSKEINQGYSGCTFNLEEMSLRNTPGAIKLFDHDREERINLQTQCVRVTPMSETTFTVQYKWPQEESWKDFHTFEGTNPTLEVSPYNGSLTLTFTDKEAQPKTVRGAHPWQHQGTLLKTRYKIEKMFEDDGTEATRHFKILYNPDPQSPLSLWREIFKTSGVEPFLLGLGRDIHVGWRHCGNQIAVLQEDMAIHDPLLWNIRYLSPGVKVLSERPAPGHPLVHKLFIDNKHMGSYDTNKLGYQGLATVMPFYVSNTLDEALPLETTHRHPGLQIPVSVYAQDTGATPLKPTLLYIKGGPCLTKHAEFDIACQALSHTFNVVLVEYRGSTKNGFAGEYPERLAGDLGGGHSRDILSVLKAVQTHAYPGFEKLDVSNIYMLGHSFGGFALARLMQDYPQEMQVLKGLILSAGSYSVLVPPSSKTLGFREYYGFDKMLYTPQDSEEPQESLEAKRKAENRIVSALFRVPLLRNLKNLPALIVAGTHDGNVYIQDSLEFFMAILQDLVPQDVLQSARNPLAALGQAQPAAAAADRAWNWAEWADFIKTAPITLDVIKGFQGWWHEAKLIVQKYWQDTHGASFPYTLKLVEGANHTYTTTPETFETYIESIKEFMAKKD